MDDDDDLREVLADVIEEAGRKVLRAKDGVEALAQLDSASRPCVVFLDLMMWPMSGQEFLERLEKRPDAADFPIVVMSAGSAVSPSEHSRPNVVAMIPKPLDLAKVKAVLDEFC